LTDKTILLLHWAFWKWASVDQALATDSVKITLLKFEYKMPIAKIFTFFKNIKLEI
jgi:hypothetical protein